MNRLSFVLLVLFAQFQLSAQLNLNKGNVSPKKYYQEVKVEFVNNKLMLPLTISGSKAKFIIDTGAPLCITNQFQQQKKYPVLTTDSIIDANGKGHLTKIVQVDEIKIGEITYNNIPALVINLEGTALECLKINGLVGSNLFRFGALKIDWLNQKIFIADSYKKLGLKKEEGNRLLINQIQSAPYLTLNVNAGITDRLLIDTGSDDFYTFSKQGLDYVQSKGYLLDAVKYESKGCGSVGLFGPDTVSSNKLIKIDSLTIGKMAHLHEFYTVTTNDDQSRVGVYLLKQGVTTIDFKRSLFFFKLYSDKFDYKYISFGFDVINDNNRLKVGSVWKDSEACKKGIRVGDLIIDIEGLNISQFEPCDVFLKFNAFIEKQKNITVYLKKPNEDKVKEITLSRLKLD